MTPTDGIESIESDQLRDLALNLNFTVDEFSPFLDRQTLAHRGESLIVDRYFGHAYHTMEPRPAAIYGRTADLPVYSGDQLANDGFLRVPFRRIPRRVVHTLTEIKELLTVIRSADQNLRLLFRGQTREHLIGRSPETTQWLYGEDTVREPSLRTSASRRKPQLEEVLPEWAALLKIFLIEDMDTRESDYDEFTTSLGFPLFALSLAQHYGLPTSGLDLTDRLEIALFFALMAYKKPSGTHRATYSRLAESSEMPVLYILFPAEQQQFDYESYRTKDFPPGRPDAQSAHFMHVGWGYADNACASRIFLALYLDPVGNFDPIPSAAELFPTGETDRFADFLERISTKGFPEKLTRILAEGFYTVVTA
jgi:FRG domain